GGGRRCTFPSRRHGGVVARELGWLTVGLVLISPTVSRCRPAAADAGPSVDLLVNSGYRPPPTLDALPPTGQGVLAVAIAKGRPAFWRTAWFRLSCLLAAVLALWLLHCRRLRQLAEQSSVRF